MATKRGRTKAPQAATGQLPRPYETVTTPELIASLNNALVYLVTYGQQLPEHALIVGECTRRALL